MSRVQYPEASHGILTIRVNGELCVLSDSVNGKQLENGLEGKGPSSDGESKRHWSRYCAPPNSGREITGGIIHGIVCTLNSRGTSRCLPKGHNGRCPQLKQSTRPPSNIKGSIAFRHNYRVHFAYALIRRSIRSVIPNLTELHKGSAVRGKDDTHPVERV